MSRRRRIRPFHADMTLGIAVQARMSSSRLPGKVLRPARGVPMLQYVVERLLHVCGRPVVVATSIAHEDDPIASLAFRLALPCHRGSLHDVAGRMLGLSIAHDFDAIVRISADSPLIDPALVDRLIGVFLDSGSDLVTNVFPRTFPRGQSVEVIKRRALQLAWPRMSPVQREHVTPFFYSHADEFDILNVRAEHPHPDVTVAVDTEDDFQRFERILARMNRPHWEYHLDEIVEMAVSEAPC